MTRPWEYEPIGRPTVPEPWPWLEARIRSFLSKGAIVEHEAGWVQMSMPGGSTQWARADYFDRATARSVTEADIAVLPAPLDRPMKLTASSALMSFFNLATASRGQQHR